MLGCPENFGMLFAKGYRDIGMGDSGVGWDRSAAQVPQQPEIPYTTFKSWQALYGRPKCYTGSCGLLLLLRNQPLHLLV